MSPASGTAATRWPSGPARTSNARRSSRISRDVHQVGWEETEHRAGRPGQLAGRIPLSQGEEVPRPIEIPPPPEGPDRPVVLARIYPGYHEEATELFQADAENL